MSIEVNIEERDETPAISVQFECSPQEIPQRLGEIYPRIVAHIKANGGTIAGPPFLRYHETGPDRLVLDGGLPLAAPIAGEGDMEQTTLPGGPQAVVVHTGPYDQLAATYQKLDDWCKASDWQPRGHCYDSYIGDPAESEPDELRTLIICPVERND